MSFDGLLIHTASVLERTYTGRDKANQPTYTWAVIVVSWPSYWERVLTGEYKFDQGNTFDGVVPDYVVFGREPAGIILIIDCDTTGVITRSRESILRGVSDRNTTLRCWR
jgi:hypothetical protein